MENIHTIKTLHSLPVGKTAVVKEINTPMDVKRRLMDLGIINGTKMRALFVSPFGDPVAYLVRGTVIALRIEESRSILIES